MKSLGLPTIVATAALLLGGCDDSFHFDVLDGGSPGSDASTIDDQSVAADVAQPPTACTDDTTCPAPSHCDLPSGTCVACVSDDQCAGVSGHPRCDTALHRCVECGNNQDCGSSSVCESSTHMCVRVCTDENQCVAPSVHCNEILQRCYECTSNSECLSPSRPRCELLTGRCFQCTSNAHCSGATHRCDVATFTCVECIAGSDCASGLCNPATRTCIN